MTTKTLNRAEQIRRTHQAAALAARAKRRKRITVTVVGVVLAAAALTGLVVGTLLTGSDGQSAKVPPRITAAGGIVVGSSAAPVHVIAYEDPQCPSCGRFERGNGRLLAKALTDGRVSVEYRMRSFLGPESVRAVNALAAAQAAGRFEALREAMYAEQPTEGTGGYTTQDLLALGDEVGLTSTAYTDAVQKMTYADWVRRIEDRASRDGNVATPTLIVDGHPLTNEVLFDAAAFQKHLLG